ncbi:olfactory receptor 5W2-like [Sarcophilus harrisii]|uniref:olfactory receptor 5W2-like n=1 Tax=Sarcophilus harrisii TaxID=9305 RepID=UPI001301B3EF|nr:olfactory receptor 5W2-like [Sarcophilus harrisii]
MMKSNYSNPSEFIFLGITSDPELKVMFFVLCLIIYLVIVLGNHGMVILIRIDTQLHLPMYFFLSHMSFCDLCYPSAIGPKMLVDFFANKSISFTGCALQLLFFSFFGDSDCLLLAVMAFDRYMAISNPLLYTVNMSSRVCYSLIAGVFMVGFINALIDTILMFTLNFCRSNKINHFFCDIPPLLSLFCSDTYINELILFIIFGFIETVTISGVLISYCYIFLSVLKIHSTEGRSKAFSTCSSHLTVFTIFQGMVLLCTSDQIV